jgi:hypothetical protein
LELELESGLELVSELELRLVSVWGLESELELVSEWGSVSESE